MLKKISKFLKSKINPTLPCSSTTTTMVTNTGTVSTTVTMNTTGINGVIQPNQTTWIQTPIANAANPIYTGGVQWTTYNTNYTGGVGQAGGVATLHPGGGAGGGGGFVFITGGSPGNNELDQMLAEKAHDEKLRKENESLQEAWEEYQLIKKLVDDHSKE